MGLSIFMALFFFCAANGRPVVDPEIQKELDAKGSVNIILHFRDARVHAVRAKALASAVGLPRGERIKIMFQALFLHARETQAEVLSFLNAKAFATIRNQTFWISNQLSVKNATKPLVDVFAGMDKISAINKELVAELVSTEEDDAGDGKDDVEVQWGVAHVAAPAVWSQGYRGQGVVIGHIDTGVNVYHEALQDAFRVDHGWFDPYEHALWPVDKNGHGTHTIGSAVGRTRGIGVAPEATFISCGGCNESGFCDQTELLMCGQFMMCPTDPEGNDPRCDLAPQIVTNSWGLFMPIFADILPAWEDAGIVSVWAAGNEGATGCPSLRQPAGSPIPITVGAIERNNSIAEFSSRGPGELGIIKPEIVAPGARILSSLHDGPDRYNYQKGTSMAAPHVAGVMALMLSYRPNLTPPWIRKYIIEAGQPIMPENETCGGLVDSVYPNYVAGYGQINALAIFKNLQNSCRKKLN